MTQKMIQSNLTDCQIEGARQLSQHTISTELSKETFAALAKIDGNIRRAVLHGKEFLVD